METCRLCLYSSGEVKILPIFNSQHGNLSGKIEECVSLKIQKDDKFTLICANCVDRLKQWEQFKQCCLKSNEILQIKTIDEMKICKVKNEGEYYFSDERNDLKPDVANNVKDNECAEQPEENNADGENICKVEIKEEYYLSDESVDLKPDIVNDVEDSECEEQLETNNACNEDLEELLKSISDDGDIKINTDYNYSCGHCNKEFQNCWEYLDHQETHNNGDYIFKCCKCVEVFNTRKSLIQHENNHKIPCEYCGKMVRKSTMKLHLYMHTDRFKCTECSKRFSHRAGLDQHRIAMHTDIKNHVCEHCGKSFAAMSAMRVHMKTHSDERKYPCKECSYTGRTASALYTHMSKHSEDVCICEQCSKSFKSVRHLRDHQRRVHPKDKKFDCSHCGKKFVEKCLLTVHLRSHTGVRPYKCEQCDKSFVRSDTLKAHLSKNICTEIL